MRTGNLKRSISILLAVAVFLSFTLAMTAEANAASSGTVKATLYTDVIKKGNTVYCNTAAGVYKVKLKNQKVVKKTCLVKNYENLIVDVIKLKGSYLYYICFYPVGGYMGRVNLKTGKDEDVFVPGIGRFKDSVSLSVKSFAFKGKRLYARINYDNENDVDNIFYTKTFAAKLNGKSVEKSKVKIVNKVKRVNKKGYKIVEKGKRSYLKTPKGKFYLGKLEQ